MGCGRLARGLPCWGSCGLLGHGSLHPDGMRDAEGLAGVRVHGGDGDGGGACVGALGVDPLEGLAGLDRAALVEGLAVLGEDEPLVEAAVLVVHEVHAHAAVLELGVGGHGDCHAALLGPAVELGPDLLVGHAVVGGDGGARVLARGQEVLVDEDARAGQAQDDQDGERRLEAAAGAAALFRVLCHRFPLLVANYENPLTPWHVSECSP